MNKCEYDDTLPVYMSTDSSEGSDNSVTLYYQIQDGAICIIGEEVSYD